MPDYADLVGRRFPPGTYTLPEYVCWLWSDAAQLLPVYDAHPALAHVVASYGMSVTVQDILDMMDATPEGGVTFGLSAALGNEITIADGRVRQSNFHDFQSLRIAEAPRVEVHLIPSGEAPGGVGETGTACVAAALCNAIFAATGKRVRKLPVSRGLKA